MKYIITIALVATTWVVLYAQGTNFIFKVGSTSVNVAEGDNGIRYAFALFADTINFEENLV